MDTASVEAILAEIGKAFRLCRFYPATHPSVQQSLAALSARLPALAQTGTLELKLQPSGMILGNAPLAPRNTQIQELARLLYSQGHRLLVLEPGLTADAVAALIRSAASGTERAMQAVGGSAAFQNLPHIRLERSARRATRAPVPLPPPRAGSGPVLGRASQVFRPDALPHDLECGRLAAAIEQGGDIGMSVDRVAALLPELAESRDFRSIARATRALCRAAAGDDGPQGRRIQQILDAQLTPAALAGLLSLLTGGNVSAEDRDLAVQALGALGPRAIPAVFDAFHVSTDAAEGDILLAVVRRAGLAAAAPILARMDPDARGQAARNNALLLGATRSADAALMLGALAMHAEAPVRRAAVEALAHIEDPEAARHLFAALRDADPSVRAAAARGIGWTGDPAQGPLIIARLQDEKDDEAAIAMIQALGELRDERAVSVLATLAGNVAGVFQRHATEIRVAAIRALGVIASAEALAAARKQVESRQPEVRQAVLDVLRSREA